MDPLTAFSLTCGVIQVVDFSTKILMKCRQIYKDGATSENKETEFMARHLTDLATDLRLPDTSQNLLSAPQLYHDDQELLRLSERCSETATELIKELQKLSIPGRQRKRDAVRKAIKVVWKKDAIENIQNSLEQYRRTLDTRILMNLRQHVHLISREHGDSIRNLDRKIQNLIIGVSQDQKTFDELKDVIQAENESTKAHISQEFQKHHEMIATEDSYKRLLESLYFPDIDARQEGIDEAHKNTFEWIFDKSGDEVQPWHSFINWLENGHGTYWVSGKAGSGKSTLMNLLCQDSRTDAALRIWSGTNEVFMPKFFFWSPGSQLQKSLAGLLRSLVYQIIERFPDLVPVLARSMGPSHHGFHQLPTWTERRLRATLQNLLSAGLEQYRMCIFIDGLDEFQGNHATLLDLIRNLREITRVKFCLSSRPYSAFRNELGCSPMLKLQDLTEPDIRRYVSDKLEGVPLKASQNTYSSFKIENAIDTIIRKAEGVFLWVNLAVRDQLEGIRNGDDVEQLHERLQILPTEIEEVYGHMLQGIEKVYRKEVARYIRSALDIEEVWSLFEFALAQHKRIDDILLLSPDISVSDINQHCKSIRERIDATCKGFLEVHESINLEQWQNMVNAPPDDAESIAIVARNFSKALKKQDLSPKQCEELTETKYLHELARIDFLHRTAFDFFIDNKQGTEFLRTHASANPHPQILYVKASLARLTMFPLPSSNDIDRSVNDIMHSASVAESVTGVAQPALMDLMNRSIKLLYQKSRDQQPHSHWCNVWGLFVPRSSLDYSRDRFADELDKDDLCQLDFLGLAAWYGLEKFVEHILDLQSGWQRVSITDYLLKCATNGLQINYTLVVPRLHLITALLKRGADPNTKVLKGTAWSFFLQLLHEGYFGYITSFSESTHYINTVLAFLRNEANVNEESYCKLLWYSGIQVVHLEDSPPMLLLHYSIKLHLSARWILQRHFAERPEFSEIEDILIASGAYLYSKCVEISFYVDEGGDCREIDPKPSEEQLNQFTQTFEKHLGYVEEREVLERQVLELIRELDMPQLFEQAPRKPGRVSESLQEEESQEDQSNTNTDHDSNSPSTNEPSSLNPEEEGPSHSARSSLEED